MKVKLFICSIFLLFGTFLTTVPSEGEEVTGISYNATAVIPENQIDKKVSYFDLLVSPGEQQKVKIKLTNSSEESIKVKITPNTARTTMNGTVDYSGMDLKSTSNLAASFEEITSKEQQVTLSPKSTKEVEFIISIPDKKIEGAILGGFYIQEIKKEEATSTKEAIQIKNEFSIVIGCQIRMSQKNVEKKFSLNDVYIDNYGGFFSVISSIHNTAPALVSFYSLKGEIKDSKNKTVHSFEKDTISMAPNSIYEFPERVATDKLQPGNYKMFLTIYSRDKKQSWNLEKKFEVQPKEKERILSKSVDKEKADRSFILYGIIVALLVIIIVFVIIILKKRK